MANLTTEAWMVLDELRRPNSTVVSILSVHLNMPRAHIIAGLEEVVEAADEAIEATARKRNRKREKKS